MKQKEVIEEKLAKTRKYSILEGSAASVMSGTGDSYIVPFALALNATNAQIGFLSSFVSLFGSISQTLSSRLVYYFPRKKIVILSVFAQATIWVLITLLGLFYQLGFIDQPVSWLIVFYSISAIVGALGGPAWFSLLGDVVPEKIRGKYFSKRNKICGSVSMTTALLAAFALDFFKGYGFLITGFLALFWLAALGRYISAYYFTKHYEPKTKITQDKYFTFFQFIKKAPTNNFGKFTIYIALINLSTVFASPFVAVYMLNELHFSYVWFTIVNLSASIFSILSMSFWGKIGDKYGNKRLLKIGAIIIPFSILFWLISPNPYIIIFTAQLVGGVGWAAFNLAASNFIYDSVTPQRRPICVAYYNMVNGVGIFIGASMGGLFLEHIKVSFMNIFLFVFLISGLTRIIISMVMLPQIKEVRQVTHMRGYQVIFHHFEELMPRPLFGFFRGVKETLFTLVRIK